MPAFLSCFPIRTKKDKEQDTDIDVERNPLRSSESDDVPYKVERCTFCSITPEKGFNVVYKDDNLIAFHDRSPRAKIHLLIVPLNHIDSVRHLTPSHIPLLRSMISLGYSLVPSNPTPKMGFHIPPFSSVPHLHMHVFSGPHTFIGRFKYPISTQRSMGDGSKGFGWFVSASQVESILERGGSVSLGRG